jgi:hypothetical protein
MTAVTAMRLTTMADPVVFRVRAMLTCIKILTLRVSDNESIDSSRSLVDARMAERNAKIHKRKMKRRGLDDSDEEESEEMFGRNPYRKLSMQEKFTPPRKKSKQSVPDSDDNSPSEHGNYDDDESVDDGDVLHRTPKRIYQTDWKVVKKWSTSTSRHFQKLTVKSMHFSPDLCEVRDTSPST